MLRVEHQLPSLKHLHQGAIIKGRNRPREVEHQPQEDSRWCTPTMRTVAQLHERPQTRGGTWLQRRSWLRGALRAGWCERRPTYKCPPCMRRPPLVGVLPCGRTFRSLQSSLVCGSCSRASKQPEGARTADGVSQEVQAILGSWFHSRRCQCGGRRRSNTKRPRWTGALQAKTPPHTQSATAGPAAEAET